MDKKLFGSNYEAPEARVLAIYSESVLCSSTDSNSDVDDLKEGSHDFGWQ